jgi:hypothetical protein
LQIVPNAVPTSGCLSKNSIVPVLNSQHDNDMSVLPVSVSPGNHNAINPSLLLIQFHPPFLTPLVHANQQFQSNQQLYSSKDNIYRILYNIP